MMVKGTDRSAPPCCSGCLVAGRPRFGADGVTSLEVEMRRFGMEKKYESDAKRCCLELED